MKKWLVTFILLGSLKIGSEYEVYKDKILHERQMCIDRTIYVKIPKGMHVIKLSRLQPCAVENWKLYDREK